MRRREDWPLQLNAAIEAARSRAFAYGAQDCLLFAADCVLAMTGEDLAAEVRGAYGSKLEALRILAERGGMEAVTTAALGAPLERSSMAQRGDVVLCEWQAGPGLGVAIGELAAVPAAEGGLHFAPVNLWLKAWRV